MSLFRSDQMRSDRSQHCLRISERRAEIHDPIVLPLRVDCMANPGLSGFQMKQIRSVGRTMQPTIHHCGRRLLSLSNVLGKEARILITEIL
jgi:hypothetical protein